ncbi:hypothetical protein [Calidifontibacillus oryziterrae]|uniref:hypothetical protein n=1 Tax=Calidifontibacillus oryziterrae TaxID=1191699 RepID=UPI0003129538|nr:hypothetical protein [Calidifontibacillus oryziterrae]
MKKYIGLFVAILIFFVFLKVEAAIDGDGRGKKSEKENAITTVNDDPVGDEKGNISSKNDFVASSKNIPDGYEMVTKSNEDQIFLYAKKTDDFYYDFKIDFKGTLYSRPFWLSLAHNPTYAPLIIYENINQDENKELIIILNKGYGSGVLLDEVYVFNTDNERFSEVLVDHPLAVLYKNVKTKLSPTQAEIRVGDKTSVVDITPLEIQPTNLFDDVAFGSIIDFEVRNNQLIVTMAAQISPAGFIGEVVIIYEYRDNMYQAKSIDFLPYE